MPVILYVMDSLRADYMSCCGRSYTAAYELMLVEDSWGGFTVPNHDIGGDIE
jgi:hypothetical protein